MRQVGEARKVNGDRPTLSFSVAADFSERAGDRLLAMGVGPDETVVAVVAETSPQTVRTPRVAAAMFVHEGATHEVELESADLPLGCAVQPLSDGGVLLVGPTQGPRDRAALVYGPDGHASHRLPVGYGVAEALIDRGGQLWVSYFDEGVFSSDPLSQHGLNRFDVATGEVTWSFVPGPNREPISDCYALNVAGREAWAYYYTPFDLVHVSQAGSVESWQTDIGFARGICVGSSGVLFFGSGVDFHDAVLLELGNGGLEQPREVELLLPPDFRKDGLRHVTGRGNRLYLMDEQRCYVAELS
jgi:hypothetical protein